MLMMMMMIRCKSNDDYDYYNNNNDTHDILFFNISFPKINLIYFSIITFHHFYTNNNNLNDYQICI